MPSTDQTMPVHEENPLTVAMELCWTITCSRCKDEAQVHRPDDLRAAAAELQDLGWIARQEPHPTKAVLDRFGLDTSNWPDLTTRIYCPQCAGGLR